MHDHRVECKSFIEYLQKHGWDVVYVDLDDGEIIKPNNLEDIIENMTACDECRVRFKKDDCRITALIVLGNSPGELLCDHTCPDHSLAKEFEQITMEWSNECESKCFFLPTLGKWK